MYKCFYTEAYNRNNGVLKMPKVKVQAKVTPKAGKIYKTLYIAIPSAFASILKIKEGEYLEVTINDVKINGKTIRALIYYKP